MTEWLYTRGKSEVTVVLATYSPRHISSSFWSILEEWEAFKLSSVSVLLNSRLTALHWKYSIDKCWLESKACFIQQANNLGRWTLVQKPTLKIVPDNEFLKGKSFGDGIRTNKQQHLCADCFLIGWWWGSSAVLQKSHVQPEITLSHLGRDLSSYRRTQRCCRREWQRLSNRTDCFAYSLRRNQDPAPQLQYCFLTVQPLFLHFFPSTLSNYLNLPFGTQYDQGIWMKPMFYK